MAILEVLHFPDPHLRTKAKPVKQVDNAIRQLVDDMFETVYKAPAIGLAATQVNVHKQIVVIDLSEEQNQPLCFINPKIMSSGGVQTVEEGCLSIPGIFEKIERPEHIIVEALNYKGESFTLKTDGLLAVCIQHEVDHLVGKLFVDYLSSLKRQRIRKKLFKQKKR
ncbi:MAG: peptide deformylase [Gammaproteobacteria bacterium]|nr:MAG: peptide deformylase [Gammaproteobacteria bacterium]RKZ38228.1 MAG: peptide deformylase [Gammaproteobacteria bacterium]RKZ72588.1 MAG: peptide deformylase [Gammaproteobacteria bacterium]